MQYVFFLPKVFYRAHSNCQRSKNISREVENKDKKKDEMRESESERETETDRRREKERKSVKILNKLSKAFRQHFSDLKLSDPKKLTFQ